MVEEKSTFERRIKVVSIVTGFYNLIDLAHGDARAAGWHANPFFSDKLSPESREAITKLEKSQRIALIHSEISEALEGIRKGKQDDHLPDFLAEEVELADAIIRIVDYAGRYNLKLVEATLAKLEYNRTRADHKPEVRAATGGKAF